MKEAFRDHELRSGTTSVEHTEEYSGCSLEGTRDRDPCSSIILLAQS